MLGSTFLLHGELSLAVAGAGAAAHPEDDGRHHSDCMRCRSQLCVGHMLFFQSAPPLTRAAMEIPFCNGASEEVRRNCGSSSSRSSSSSTVRTSTSSTYTSTYTSTVLVVVLAYILVLVLVLFINSTYTSTSTGAVLVLVVHILVDIVVRIYIY